MRCTPRPSFRGPRRAPKRMLQQFLRRTRRFPSQTAGHGSTRCTTGAAPARGASPFRADIDALPIQKEKTAALCLALPGRGAQVQARQPCGCPDCPGLPRVRRGRAMRHLLYFSARGRDGRRRRCVRRPAGAGGYRRGVRLPQHAGACPGHGVLREGTMHCASTGMTLHFTGAPTPRQHARAGPQPRRRHQRAGVRPAGLYTAGPAQGHGAGHGCSN